ncbi:MAG: NTP transferase domain-containing protein [Alphaproteobacteria bacterium]|nr:NTP transferase domain-containing protein [Alphaproteobacteria bacterium]
MRGVWAIVPARLASTRLPNKVLADLHGRPLVWHVWDRAARSGAFDRVLVATDHPSVEAALGPLGVDVVLTDPAPNGTARVASVAPRDVAVVNVQGDQPHVDPQHLALLAASLAPREVRTLAAPLALADLHDPARVKVSADLADFSRRPFPGAPPRVHVGIYGFGPGLVHRCAASPSSDRSRREDLEQLTWIDAGIPVRAIVVDRAATSVDTASDLDRARRGDPGGASGEGTG